MYSYTYKPSIIANENESADGNIEDDKNSRYNNTQFSSSPTSFRPEICPQARNTDHGAGASRRNRIRIYGEIAGRLTAAAT